MGFKWNKVRNYAWGIVPGYFMNESEKKERQAKDRAQEAENRQRAIEAERAANIGKIREQYGIGDSELAKTNQRTIADAINQYYQSLLQQNTNSANQQFATASRTSRQNLARIGQMGGGLDSAARSGTLADFLRARQDALTQASSARDAFKGNIDSQRLGYENAVSGGTVATPDFNAIQSQRSNLLKQAQGNIIPQMVGNLFTTAGNTYFNAKMQEAQGNQGLQAFNFTNSNGGRITGGN
jgi:hypothetical protein